ncbi:MAG TPA: TolC family protein [Parasulfuritortus sp.]
MPHPDIRRTTLAALVALAFCSGPAPAAATEPADLKQVLRAIAEHSPDVLAAQAARRQTDAQVRQARAVWFGKIDAYGLSQHYNDPRLTRPITQPPNVASYPFGKDQFGYGLDMQLPIDLSRQIAAEVDAARNRAAGARWSAEDVRLRSLLQGAALYRNLEALAGQRAAFEKQLDALRTSARVAQAGLKAGTIARVSLLRVQAAVAEAEAALAGVAGQDLKVRAQLAALMSSDDFAAPVDQPQAGPAALPTDPGTPAPTLQAAQNALAANQARLHAAERAEWPQTALTGGWNHNAVQWDQQPVETWQIMLAVRMNLWAGGGQKGAVDAAQAATDEARDRLAGAQAALRAARTGALAQWHAQEAAWHAAQSGLDAARESARIEQDRFKTGLGSATELTDAEAALARARAAATGALANWWQADDALRYAYGEPPLAYAETTHTPPSADGASQP